MCDPKFCRPWTTSLIFMVCGLDYDLCYVEKILAKEIIREDAAKMSIALKYTL